jgi:HEPN domain-containing protein
MIYLLSETGTAAMDEKVKYWLELADYDLATAGALLEKERFLYVGFMCQQVIEKALKAYWHFSLGTIPPKVHGLSYLLDKTELTKSLKEESLDFIDELEPLNIQSRYPEYKDALLGKMDSAYTKSILKRTEDLYAWLKTKLS